MCLQFSGDPVTVRLCRVQPVSTEILRPILRLTDDSLLRQPGDKEPSVVSGLFGSLRDEILRAPCRHVWHVILSTARAVRGQES